MSKNRVYIRICYIKKQKAKYLILSHPYLICFFQECIISADLDMDNVTPIFMRGNKNRPDSYKPVSLSAVGKLLESTSNTKSTSDLSVCTDVNNTMYSN